MHCALCVVCRLFVVYCDCCLLRVVCCLLCVICWYCVVCWLLFARSRLFVVVCFSVVDTRCWLMAFGLVVVCCLLCVVGCCSLFLVCW